MAFFKKGALKMTKSEAAVSETDAVIFPMEFAPNSREKVSVERGVPSATIVVEKQPINTDFEVRFARLRKSVRKRSASIL
jgi:hypothetical protein